MVPGEKLSKNVLTEMVEDCAKHLGFDQNQYIAVHHNDTSHQHIHIVANRVGFDGRTVKDNHNYQKIASYCRKMEFKYGLIQVPSPGRFLAREQRQIPRHDTRKEQLKQDIKECLLASKNYGEFENKIEQKGYEIFKGRGIAFMDKQKVYTKGSEVGYSLQAIEKILSIHPALRQASLHQKDLQENKKTSEQRIEQKQKFGSLTGQRQDTAIIKINETKTENQKERCNVDQSKVLEQLLNPEQQQERINPALLKKKKRKRHRLHL